MISVILNILSWMKSNTTLLLIGIIISLGLFVGYQTKRLKLKDIELASAINNKEFYESLTSKTSDKNRVLQLTVDQLQTTNDSILQEVNKLKKELKIKDKELNNVVVVETQIRDTDSVYIASKTIDFPPTEIKFNELTKVIISRTDSVLKSSIDVKNKQTLFVITTKQYRNKYKNWFKRFVHFDWKKDKVNTYQIANSNDLVKVTDTRVIEIKAD